MMHTNACEGEDGGAGRRHEERTKELEIGKEAIYAMPFRGATVAMEAVPRRGVYREGGRKKKEVKMRRYAPCGAVCCMVRVHGGASERRDEGRNDINTLLGGEKGKK